MSLVFSPFQKKKKEIPMKKINLLYEWFHLFLTIFTPQETYKCVFLKSETLKDVISIKTVTRNSIGLLYIENYLWFIGISIEKEH